MQAPASILNLLLLSLLAGLDHSKVGGGQAPRLAPHPARRSGAGGRQLVRLGWVARRRRLRSFGRPSLTAPGTSGTRPNLRRLRQLRTSGPAPAAGRVLRSRAAAGPG